jgi:hypothetical protein
MASSLGVEIGRQKIGGERMGDLRSRASAFICSHCAMPLDGMEMMHLIKQYAAGEPFDDLELRKQLSVELQYAQSETAVFQGASSTSGPAHDAFVFYQGAAEILQEIRTEVEVDRA